MSQIYKAVLPSTYYMSLLDFRPTSKDHNLSILTSSKNASDLLLRRPPRLCDGAPGR